MNYDPDKHRRRSIRLKGYDYSQNAAYYITVCVYEQRGFHDRIIRNERELETKRRYIESNPSKWSEDEENPLRGRP